MENVIEAHNVRKRYGEVEAVAGVSFSVTRGEFFGLLGPNGAGKTTTIRMMYGFSPIDSGQMLVFGLDINLGWREIRSRLGVCQQENTLDPDLTVIENLLIFAGYFAMPRRRALQRAQELLDFFALDKKRDAKVGELSGGMSRRLMLARALINNPELLILDEPTTGLDPQSRHLLWDRLETLRKGGLTIVLTTHYMEEAAHLCDRLVIVDHGKVLVEGTPEALVAAHVGQEVIEVEAPTVPLRAFLAERHLESDEINGRLIVYSPGEGLGEHIRSTFCVGACSVRLASLEDVFLRLTGRELRE